MTERLTKEREEFIRTSIYNIVTAIVSELGRELDAVRKERDDARANVFQDIALLRDIDALKAQLATARKALEYYADAQNWIEHIVPPHTIGGCHSFLRDEPLQPWTKAREALKGEATTSPATASPAPSSETD